MLDLEPPRWLSTEAKVLFTSTLEALGAKAIPSDASVIADFAQAQADMEDLTMQIRLEGETLTSDKGNTYTNPIMNLLISRRKDLERLRDDLGLTPKCRGVKIETRGKSSLAKAMNR